MRRLFKDEKREILQNNTNKLIGITKPSIEIFLTREEQDTETHKKILEAVREFITSTGRFTICPAPTANP